MSVVLGAASELPDKVGAIGVGVFSDFETTRPGAGVDGEQLARRGFRARVGESLVVPGTDAPLEVLVGLGERGHGLEPYRRAGAALVRATIGIDEVAFDLRGFPPNEQKIRDLAQAVGEGALLASYRFSTYKSGPSDESSEQLLMIGKELKALAAGLERAGITAGAVELARDLVNTPATELTPRRFAELASDVAAEEDFAIEVFEEEAIAELHLGGLLGVARGSVEPPRLVRIAYTPAGSASVPTIALVGKGITFDSGGLSLKSADGMVTMKTDMSGAAAVLAVVSTCARLKVKVKVVGFMPLTENMPGGAAIKPGDVLRIRNGKTIEVLNTDAEGRLVLADALSLAAEEGPDAIIDLATLTGACIAALGDRIAGVMGNDDRLIAQLEGAGRTSGEPIWPLPLAAGYRRDIDSDVADMQNTGAKGKAGALAAGLLLEEFVGEVPWAHLDIAGPSRASTDSGYLPKGATGFGVRTLIELLASYEKLGGSASGSIGKEVLR